MAKQTIESKDILHATNERVRELEIVIKGSFIATSGDVIIDLPYGSMIGLMEHPGELYRFDYEAKEDSITVSYPYKNPGSVQAIIKANPQIAPYITTAIYSCIQELFEKTAQVIQACRDLIDVLGTGEKLSYDLQVWKYEFFRSLGNMLPSKDVAFCTGFILSGYEYTQYLSFILSELLEKKSEYELQKQTKTDEAETESDPGKEADAAEGDPEADVDDSEAVSELMGSGGSADDEDKPDEVESGEAEDMSDALERILEYSGVSEEKAEKFRTYIADFIALPDKTDTSDKARLLRRQLSEVFYDVYEGAFMRSITDRDIPLVMKMFFYFGFVSEELAGKKNTGVLQRLARNYEPDPEGNVLTAYEWIRLIYDGKVEPSKNEFDMEYPKYLKQRYDDGEIKQADMKRLLDDQGERLRLRYGIS